jgi:hypothetical protein
MLYLAVVLLGPIRLLYIPNALFVTGNAAATAHNIASHEQLFRIGIFADLLTATVEIFVMLALYRLLNGAGRTLALVMVILGMADVPNYFINTLNDFGALAFARGTGFAAAFAPPQRDAMVMQYLYLHHYGVVVNEVFWGLWLLPFGVLVYRSGFLPRVLGAWLVLNGGAYLAQNAAGVLLPQYADLVANIALPLQFGEVAIVLWLIVMGAKERSAIAAPGS